MSTLHGLHAQVTMQMVVFNEAGWEIDVLPGPYAPDGTETEEARVFARSLIAQIDRLRVFAAERYLAIYNTTWRDEEEGEPELDQQAFIQNLGEASIVLYDELGAACVYFSADDLFGGHSIQVSINDFEPARATLVG